MSLIVQVAGGGVPPSQPQKGGVMTASSHIQASTRPPPAHVTQLTSSPSLGQSPHVVQHHPQPAPHPAAREAHSLSPSYPRPLPLSPHRAHHLAHPRSRAAHISTGRMLINTPMNHLPTPPMPHLPSSPLPLLTPSPAHQLLPSSVNSPSLIPQNIPSGYMPRLPIHVPSPRHLPQSHTRPAPAPQFPLGPQLSSDTNILPPHAFRKLTRPISSQPDDDIEVGENQPHQARRALMSPKHNRRNYFNNLALQDHNYCAAPPPSPPRSPTPPPSTFPTSLPPQPMGVPPVPHDSVSDEPHHNYGTSSSTPAPCVGGYPSPHYTGPPLPVAQVTSPLHRLRQTIEDAGVGPMTPLGEAGDRDCKAKDRSASDNMEDGGEETETAPEADDDNQDDSVTRCICDFLHDDGYMICCDKCSVWQHVVCMGLDRNNIPDEYLCEKCHPRFVDRNFRKRAKALQRAREKEIFARMHPNADSSDDDKMSKTALGSLGGVGFTSKNRKPFSPMTRKLQGKKSLEKKLFENKKVLKKNYKRRGVLKTETSKMPQEVSTSPKQESPIKKLSPRKNIRRRSVSASDAETEEENTDSLSLRSWIDNYEEAVTNHYSPELRARLQGAKLPSNYFKPKDVNGIREQRCNVSLRGNGLKVLTANNFIPQHTPVIECRGKYMLGGNKGSRNLPFVLVHRLSQDIEVVVDGKTYGNDSRFCRRADIRTGESNAVVKHHLEKGSLHLYIVATKNIDKNMEILLPPLEMKNGLVDGEMSIQEEIREIRKVTGERKVVNGTLEGRRRGVSSSSVKRRIKRENVKKKEMAGSSSDEDENDRAARDLRVKEERERLAAQREERERERKEERPPSPRKTRYGGDRGMGSSGGVDTSSDRDSVDQILEQVVSVKEEQDDLEEEEEQQTEKILETVLVKEEKILEPVTIKEEKLEPEVEHEEKEEEIAKEVIAKEEKLKEEKPLSILIPKEEKDSPSEQISPAPSMTSPAGLQKSPGKASLGLPDQSGLIVGVNTINYDVSIRNKAKTREEKKMEMIMKAIEAMERAEARKRSEGGDSSSDKPEKKRRRSNSVKTGAPDSALDQSSADEGCVPGQASRVKGKGRGRRQTGGGLGGRRRSRAKSGDSSALSEAETTEEIAVQPLIITPNLNIEKTDQFKFPRHKKTVVECEADDDVSKQYLRGSRSPPGIANHLLRSARTDKTSQDKDKKHEEKSQINDKNIGCSAKKRWLRAAMSEDTTEENFLAGHTSNSITGISDEIIGSASPAQASPEPDYTPLKKRRLATYNETEEQMRVEVGDNINTNNLNLSSPVNEKLKSLPNGLKKRLISNLVLEAVLDRAMEDYGGDKRQNNPVVDHVGDQTVQAGASGSCDQLAVKEPYPLEKEVEKPAVINVEIIEKKTGDKPKSYKDRKKEAIIKAESDIQKNSAEIVSSAEIIKPEAPVVSVESNITLVQQETPALTDHSPTETADTVAESAVQPLPVPDTVNPSVTDDVPDKDDDVPAEEEEFCSTPLQDEDMADAVTQAEGSTNLRSPSSPSSIKESLLEKVSPVSQLLEAVSPMDTSTVSSCPTPGTPVFDEPDLAVTVDSDVTAATPLPPAVSCPPVPMQHQVFKSFFSTDLSVEDIDRQLEARRELLVREARDEIAREERNSSMTAAPCIEAADITAVNSCQLESPGSEDSRPGSAGSSETVQQPTCQTKKRVSLADYKKRKQQGGGREGRNSESSNTPSFSHSISLPGTMPTLPLTNPPLSLPSLPDLPGLESFSARSGREERSSRADRRLEKGRNKLESVGSRHTTPSPVSSLPQPRVQSGLPPAQHIPPPAPLPTPDHPREDLTERLRKEFGLNIDESDGEGSGGEGERRLGEERSRESREGGEKRETASEERERVEKFRDKSSEVKSYSEKSRDGYSDKSRDSYSGKFRDGYSDKSRDGYSDKSRDSYSDKSGYRDSREGYRDKSRESYSEKPRDTDIRGSKKVVSNHGGARRPPHPASPTNCAPGRGLPNQGGARRPPHHPSSPTRRNSQDSAYSHPSSYYNKSESSRRNNFSRNFYTS